MTALKKRDIRESVDWDEVFEKQAQRQARKHRDGKNRIPRLNLYQREDEDGNLRVLRNSNLDLNLNEDQSFPWAKGIALVVMAFVFGFVAVTSFYLLGVN